MVRYGYAGYKSRMEMFKHVGVSALCSLTYGLIIENMETKEKMKFDKECGLIKTTGSSTPGAKAVSTNELMQYANAEFVSSI